MDYFKLIDKIESALCELTGEQVYDLFTDWNGVPLLEDDFYQYLVDDFYKYLVDEGILEDEDEGVENV